jgi:hypothetical protein
MPLSICIVISKQLAREAELRFASELTRKGWSIFFPYGEDSPIDILAYKNRQFIKIQVKSTKEKNGAIICKLRSTNNWQNKKYKKEEIDFFGFYDKNSKRGYLIPIKDVENMSEIKIRTKEPKNNQKKKIRYAKQYIYFE